MNPSAALAEVNTQPQIVETDELPITATRYGFVPIKGYPVHPKDFAFWETPVNQFIPFRSFPGESVRATEITVDNPRGEILKQATRNPTDQVIDLQRVVPFFMEFIDLAKLLDEGLAATVITRLLAPRSCEKYPRELANKCLSCWTNYLLFDADIAIKQLPAELQEAAYATKDKLVEGFEAALTSARTSVDEMIRDIDDPKNSKQTANATDLLYIYHTHANRPKFRTSTSNEDSIDKLATLLIGRTTEPGQPAINADAIAQIVADTVEKAVQPLREENEAMKARLEAYEKPSESVTGNSDVVLCDAKTKNDQPCKGRAIKNGKCMTHAEPD